MRPTLIASLTVVVAVSAVCVMAVAPMTSGSAGEWSDSESKSSMSSSTTTMITTTVAPKGNDDDAPVARGIPPFDDVVRCPQSDDSSNNHIGHDHSAFRYPSTSIAYSVIALQSFVFGILILVKYDGLKVLKVEGTASIIEGYQSMTQRDEDFKMERRKERVKCTDNRTWAAYFFVLFFQFTLSALLLHFNFFETNKEALRIGTLLVRVCLGLSCCLLTTNLILQRIYRTKDYAQGAVNQLRVRQGKISLIVCGILYLIYVGGEFVASHVFAKISGTVLEVLFWCYIAALICINLPAVLATVWVCFHKAQIQPTKKAKAIALVGIIIHFFSMPPPSFWNMHVLNWFVTSHPCPFHYMSFFDLVLCITFVGSCFLMTFVILEYKRNVLLMLEERMNATNKVLHEETNGYITPGRAGYGGTNQTNANLNMSNLSDDSLNTIGVKSGGGIQGGTPQSRMLGTSKVSFSPTHKDGGRSGSRGGGSSRVTSSTTTAGGSSSILGSERPLRR